MTEPSPEEKELALKNAAPDADGKKEYTEDEISRLRINTFIAAWVKISEAQGMNLAEFLTAARMLISVQLAANPPHLKKVFFDSLEKEIKTRRKRAHQGTLPRKTLIGDVPEYLEVSPPAPPANDGAEPGVDEFIANETGAGQ